MKKFVLYDRDTGFVFRTGDCDEASFELQAQLGHEAVLETDIVHNPNTVRIDLATLTVVARETQP